MDPDISQFCRNTFQAAPHGAGLFAFNVLQVPAPPDRSKTDVTVRVELSTKDERARTAQTYCS